MEYSNSFSSTSSDEDDRIVRLKNPNIAFMPEDVLYHFALSTKTHDIKAMFRDVRFVVVGGSAKRMENFAEYIKEELKYAVPAGQGLINIAGATDRYALYKVGPVLVASHGMGFGSMSIMMHEIIKILYHAEASSDVMFFRIGTCGGLGLEPGTVVISESAVDGLLRPQLDLAILGKVVSRPALLDAELVEEMVACSSPQDNFKVIRGKTMCTQDFYEGQGRLDGAFCDFNEQDKMAFLHMAYDSGVRNIEMESLCFAAMCHHAGIKGAVACVTLLDRLNGDQITSSNNVLKEFGERPARLVAKVIRKKLGLEE